MVVYPKDILQVRMVFFSEILKRIGKKSMLFRNNKRFFQTFDVGQLRPMDENGSFIGWHCLVRLEPTEKEELSCFCEDLKKEIQKTIPIIRQEWFQRNHFLENKRLYLMSQLQQLMQKFTENDIGTRDDIYRQISSLELEWERRSWILNVKKIRVTRVWVEDRTLMFEFVTHS